MQANFQLCTEGHIRSDGLMKTDFSLTVTFGNFLAQFDCVCFEVAIE